MQTNIDGTKTITLGGREYVLRPGFRALARVERLLDMSTGELISSISSGRLAMYHAAVMAQAMIVEGGKWSSKEPAPSVDDVGEWLVGDGGFQTNLAIVTGTWMSAIKAATDTGAEASGNAGAPASP